MFITCSFCEEVELKVLEYLIHHGLEGTWQVCQTKEHDPWFKETIFGFECCFLFISCLDLDIIVSPSYIKFGKDMCILYLTDKIRDEWQGIAILDGVFIQLLVVLNWSEFTVFLFHKEEG